MSVKNFAAFIMTYERPSEVEVMIRKLMEQTLVPEKILVVDNSDSHRTEALLLSLGNEKVSYYRVGYNSGPAGAAHFGLKRLTEEGYEWIYWGDDDDPPRMKDDFERVFSVIDRASCSVDKIGIIGKVAGKFNPLTARTFNFMNKDLTKGIMEGDFVPGNNVSIIHSTVVRSGALPRTELFFGFEELDFCLQVKRKGYKILFDAGAYLERRKAAGNVDPSYRWRGRSIGESDKLWRQYYSTRNMLYVLAVNKLWIALGLTTVKTVLKGLYGFRFGRKYGARNFEVQMLALVHFVTSRSGRADLESILKE